MSHSLTKIAPAIAILAGSMGLGGCATKGFVREEIATVNQRIDGLDARLQTTDGTAKQALAEGQAASGLAQQNGQRIDQLNGRVDGLDQQMQMQAQQRQRKPRG